MSASSAITELQRATPAALPSPNASLIRSSRPVYANSVSDPYLQSIAVILIFVALSLGALFTIAGSLQYLFPAMAFAAAAFLFWRDKTLYVSFCFWLWFLSPFVRRLVDYRTGWTPTSYILLAPVLATFVSGYLMLRHPETFVRASGVPFACALAAILYGTIVGLSRYPAFAVMQALANWLVPVCFGFFLYHERRRYRQFQTAFERCFLYGMLVMGGYGVFQFFVLPDWDRLWMRNVAGGPFGVIAPMGARVFSTMNAPAPFATVIMAGLLLLFGLRGRLRIVAAGLGFLAITFSTSRSSWLGLVLGAAYLASQLEGRQRMRMIAAAFGCMILLVAAIQTPAAQEIVSKRVTSLTDPKNDVSFNQRISGHLKAFATLADEPFGEGLGSTIVDHVTLGDEDGLGPHDSTVLELLYGIGWAGSLLYGVGLAAAVLRLLGRFKLPGAFGAGLRAILVGYGCQILLNSILIGVDGFMVWSCLALALAGGEARERERPYAATQSTKVVQPCWTFER